MLRLNTSIPPAVKPSIFGLLGGDPAGFPNGRRVFDDVVSIELRALAGVTVPLVDKSFTPDAAAGLLTDGTDARRSGNSVPEFVPLSQASLTTATTIPRPDGSRARACSRPVRPCQRRPGVGPWRGRPSPAHAAGAGRPGNPGQPPGRRSCGADPSVVRPRTTGRGTQYAAVYPQLAAGTYTVWDDVVTSVVTVTIHGGQVTTARWPSYSRHPDPDLPSNCRGSNVPAGVMTVPGKRMALRRHRHEPGGPARQGRASAVRITLTGSATWAGSILESPDASVKGRKGRTAWQSSARWRAPRRAAPLSRPAWYRDRQSSIGRCL